MKETNYEETAFTEFWGLLLRIEYQLSLYYTCKNCTYKAMHGEWSVIPLSEPPSVLHILFHILAGFKPISQLTLTTENPKNPQLGLFACQMITKNLLDYEEFG